jgi:hypothetical protein
MNNNQSYQFIVFNTSKLQNLKEITKNVNSLSHASKFKGIKDKIKYLIKNQFNMVQN